MCVCSLPALQHTACAHVPSTRRACATMRGWTSPAVLLMLLPRGAVCKTVRSRCCCRYQHIYDLYQPPHKGGKPGSWMTGDPAR